MTFMLASVVMDCIKIAVTWVEGGAVCTYPLLLMPKEIPRRSEIRVLNCAIGIAELIVTNQWKPFSDLMSDPKGLLREMESTLNSHHDAFFGIRDLRALHALSATTRFDTVVENFLHIRVSYR